MQRIAGKGADEGGADLTRANNKGETPLLKLGIMLLEFPHAAQSDLTNFKTLLDLHSPTELVATVNCARDPAQPAYRQLAASLVIRRIYHRLLFKAAIRACRLSSIIAFQRRFCERYHAPGGIAEQRRLQSFTGGVKRQRENGEEQNRDAAGSGSDKRRRVE